MNILLLFVSTLHTPGGSTSVYSGYTGEGDKRENYPYLSQLEPGSKYFFNKLAAKGEKFGRVIALCTPETLKGVSFTVSGTDVSYENVSSYEFFRRRMTAFLGNDDAETDIFVEEPGIEPTRFDIMVQGEFVFTYRLVCLLKANGYRVLSSCSERRVSEYTDGNGITQSRSEFEFVGFREY